MGIIFFYKNKWLDHVGIFFKSRFSAISKNFVIIESEYPLMTFKICKNMSLIHVKKYCT